LLDLHKGAKEYEHFHLQEGPPVPSVRRNWLYRITRWNNLQLQDGTVGFFESWWLIGNAIHWYKGNVKCDGSRTRAYWKGELDDGVPPVYIPDPNKYVMATTEKEKFSVRFFVDPGEPTWDGMGGS
jgi:hypothetical protein